MKKDENTKAVLAVVVGIAFLVSLLGLVVWNSHRLDLKESGTESSVTTTDPPLPPSDRNENGCYTPETVRNHYNETGCVEYTVGYVYETSAGTQFLDEKEDYQNGFVGYIPYNAEKLDINSLLGKDIQVSGDIQEYKGYPQIVINQASQVRVYE